MRVCVCVCSPAPLDCIHLPTPSQPCPRSWRSVPKFCQHPSVLHPHRSLPPGHPDRRRHLAACVALRAGFLPPDVGCHPLPPQRPPYNLAEASPLLALLLLLSILHPHQPSPSCIYGHCEVILAGAYANWDPAGNSFTDYFS